MARLIDEDILIKRIYEYQSNTIATEDVIHSIKTMPTAYDVEKVERQIKDYFCKVIDKQKGDTVPFDILEYNKAICEIVRKGGVE
jgi:hypothetical protein